MGLVYRTFAKTVHFISLKRVKKKGVGGNAKRAGLSGSKLLHQFFVFCFVCLQVDSSQSPTNRNIISKYLLDLTYFLKKWHAIDCNIYFSMRSLCIHNFQSKREGSIVERAEKFLACFVDNSLKFMIHCTLLENYQRKVRRQLTHMGWDGIMVVLPQTTHHSSFSMRSHSS